MAPSTCNILIFNDNIMESTTLPFHAMILFNVPLIMVKIDCLGVFEIYF
jgi:hypothetical protein